MPRTGSKLQRPDSSDYTIAMMKQACAESTNPGIIGFGTRKFSRYNALPSMATARFPANPWPTTTRGHAVVAVKRELAASSANQAGSQLPT